jgi:hypothetical protein
MEPDLSYVGDNYRVITDRINEAKAKYRKPEEKITLIGVTKTVAPEIINYSVDLGVTDLGENRVQEYLSKKDAYRKNVNMHFIGHLQTNKVKYIINDMTLIHSVDSVKLAAEINRQAEKISKIQDILLEVNIGDENSKSGIEPKQLDLLLDEISKMSNLRVRGLMAIPPAIGSEKFLCMMQEIFEEKKKNKPDNCLMDILSMGMSGDYQKAIQYGATCVRIGTSLYGARNYS